MADAAVEAGLPVETRLQVPVRLYPGDHAGLNGNARHAASDAADADVALTARGAGVEVEASPVVRLPGGGQAAFDLDVAPVEPGRVEVVAAARTSAGSDSIGSRIEVASSQVPGKRVQAGWLVPGGIVLDAPRLPTGATDARLQVELNRGAAGFVDRWTHDLRDYPHRCWEQILSRAVGAALALERHDDAWPAAQAQAAVDEALRNAAVFQDENGGFQFFTEALTANRFGNAPPPQVALTAYSVQALELLQRLGHPVSDGVLERARSALRDALREKAGTAALPFAASAIEAEGTTRDALWSRWPALDLPQRLATAEALARAGDTRTDEALRRLVATGVQRGARRMLPDNTQWSRWMASSLREQCRLIGLLGTRPQFADARRAFVAGSAISTREGSRPPTRRARRTA